MSQYPKRIDAHVLETESQRYFHELLPSDWLTEIISNDYGSDLRIEISNSGKMKGFEFLVQLKSSVQPSSGDYEKIRLKVSTYNYLWGKLQVVMLVKYIRSKNQAYWILLSDVPDPNQSQKTFTVYIPKSNTLSSIKWDKIKKYVTYVTYKKTSLREKGGFGRM